MGKVCVVTGASQGIGRAAAVRMSREVDVDALVLIARNAGGLDGTAGEITAEGKRVEIIPYDLTDLDGIPTLVKRIHDDYGSIDILLNIAGYADPQSLLDTSTENIVQTYTINVFAMLILIRETARYMIDRPAKILNVASTAGITSRPGWLAYASSKAASCRSRRRSLMSSQGAASRSTRSRPVAPPRNCVASSHPRRTRPRSCSPARSPTSSRS